jgi:phosphomethylpyrimidine synthase
MKKALRSKRLVKIPARGGALLAGWMLHNKSENPYYKNFDYICELLGKSDVCLSLGNSLRAGAVCDALDHVEKEGILAVGKLMKKTRKIGVQTQVEAGSHIPMSKIESFVNLVKSICKHAPIGTLGPLVTDIGAGYDHVVQAIGQALGVKAGLDYVTAVTRSEHIGIPSVGDTIEGLVSARLAVHAGMMARSSFHMKLDIEVSRSRAAIDHERQLQLVFDPETVKKIERRQGQTNECSMCGDFCALRMLKDYGKRV